MDAVWPTDADKRELRGLVELIRRGQCVLVLGPRVAVRASDPDRQPLDELLAAQLLTSAAAAAADPDAERAPVEPATGAAPTGLRQAAERCLRTGHDRVDVEIDVQDFFRREGQTPTEFHSCLAQLPFQLCINTSLDDLMFNALQGAGKAPQRAWFDFNPNLPQPRRLSLPSVAQPLVYHLLGHPEDGPSMVLSEGDLIDFVTAIVRNSPPLPDQVRSVLADPSSSFLFLGFGFHNWYLRLLLKVLNVYNHRNRTLAFEDSQFFARPDHGEAVGFFSGDRAIEFRPLRWEAFARLLLETWTDRQAAAGGQAPPLSAAPLRPVVAAATAPASVPAAAAPPLVFLSYASDDHDAVAALADDLGTLGVRVWRDEQDLQAGDNWAKVLVSLISQQVDYVVVVQTPAMLARVRGVFNEEIAVALQQQARMGFCDGVPLRFVVPVRLGTDRLLPSLQDLHAIAVDEPGGLQALAKALLDDWARRAQVQAGGRAA